MPAWSVQRPLRKVRSGVAFRWSARGGGLWDAINSSEKGQPQIGPPSGWAFIWAFAQYSRPLIALDLFLCPTIQHDKSRLLPVELAAERSGAHFKVGKKMLFISAV
jgi:hypothetical protein